MKISVVMASFNSAKTIRHAIDSFLRQSHPDKELVIIDGGSTDATANIVHELAAPNVTWLSEKDDGIYDAMNKGMAQARGDIVGFLNSDDAFHDESALESISDALADADIVYGDISMVADHVSKKQMRIWKAGRFSRTAFHLGWMPPHPTFYVRKAVLEKVGKFDTRYRIAGDYDLMLRVLMLHAFRIRYLSKTLVDYQLGGASSSGLRSIIKSNLECLDSRRRHLGHMTIDLAFFLKPASKVLQIQWPHKREVRQAPGR